LPIGKGLPKAALNGLKLLAGVSGLCAVTRARAVREAKEA